MITEKYGLKNKITEDNSNQALIILKNINH